MYPVVEKRMMTRLNVSGVPIGNIRFVLKLALSIICYWILLSEYNVFLYPVCF